MNNGPERINEPEGMDAGDSELKGLEAELARSLRRLELPLGFADRVLAAAAATTPGPRRVLPFRLWRPVAGGALAASLLAGAFGAEAVHRRHARERAEAAAEQLQTAMRVTNHALDETRAQLARAGFRM